MTESVLSLVTALYMPFLLIKQREEIKLSTIIAVQLLTIVATVVSSASSALIAGVLPDPDYALVTVLIV